MKDGAKRHYLAETIAEVTNLKILEIYRVSENIYEARQLDKKLTELSLAIIDAISTVPEPDEYETWLNEKIRLKPEDVALCFEVPIKPLDKKTVQPSTGQVITPPSPAATTPGAPTSGDAPDLQESNECITTTVQQQAPTGPDVDNVADSPGRGGEPATPNNQEASAGPDAEPDDKGQTPTGGGDLDVQEQQISDIGMQLKGWLDEQGLSPWAAAKSGKINITEQSIQNIITGKTANPSPANMKEIRRVIKPKKKRGTPTEPPAKNKTAGSAKPNGEGPAKFVQMKLAAWMSQKRLGVHDAAAMLDVTESVIRDITNGIMPHENTLRHLGARIPSLGNNMRDIIRQLRVAN